jgi:histidinol-phosphate/aromatic aminotransferase/cobyric acid decarboxylase-like protein
LDWVISIKDSSNIQEIFRSKKFQKLVKHSKEGDVILLCIPQNPSGEQLQWSALIPVVEEFSDRNISWILDESFIEMTQSNYQGSLEFLDQFPNLFSCV